MCLLTELRHSVTHRKRSAARAKRSAAAHCPAHWSRYVAENTAASGSSEIFLCRGGQGGLGEHGVWLSIWVADVDAVHATCDRHGITVLQTPRDEPWGVREMLIEHPDGHTFRISQATQTGH